METFVGRMPTILILCLDSFMFMWLFVVQTQGKVTEEGSSLGYLTF
jgi:hypothetical protein